MEEYETADARGDVGSWQRGDEEVLRVSITVENWAIEEVLIRRLTQWDDAGKLHLYSIGTVRGEQMTTFVHRGSDGTLVCLRKGLEALEERFAA